MDTDVIKLIESKHEVTLLGSNLNEFCVKFYGPRGELWHQDAPCQSLSWAAFSSRSSHYQSLTIPCFRYCLRIRYLEGSSTPARALPFQVSFHRIYEQNLSSQHRRGLGNSLLGRHKSSLDGFIRSVEYFRVLPAPTSHVPQPHRPAEWGCCCHVPSQARRLQKESQRWVLSCLSSC